MKDRGDLQHKRTGETALPKAGSGSLPFGADPQASNTLDSAIEDLVGLMHERSKGQKRPGAGSRGKKGVADAGARDRKGKPRDDSDTRVMLHIARAAFKGNADMLLKIAKGFMETGYASDAVTTAKEAIAADPTYPASYFILGTMNANRGDIDEAVKAFKKVIELDPSHPLPRIALGDCYMAQDRFAKALASYNTAAAMPEVHGCAIVGQAHALFRMGRTEEGIAAAEKAKPIAESCSMTSYKLGLFYLLVASVIPDAIHWFRNCLKLDPDDFKAYSSLADAHLMNGDADAVVACINELAKVSETEAVKLLKRLTQE